MKRASPGLEIYVYVDGATDRTAERLRAYESEIRLVVGTERRGKTHGMNRLVAMVDVIRLQASGFRLQVQTRSL